mgnify:FL=1
MSSLFLLLLLPIVFLAWSVIHELSHYFILKQYVKIKTVKFRFYPHVLKSGQFAFASITWTANRTLNEYQSAKVSMAPRIPDLLSVILFVFWGTMSTTTLMLLWILFWGGGLVDLFVGSIGVNRESDLQRMSRGFKINSWVIRSIGMSTILLSLLTSIFVYLKCL